MSELFLTHSGDLVFEDRDFKTVDYLDEAIQSVAYRLKTAFSENNLLENIIGEFMTRDTIGTIQKELSRIITTDNITLARFPVEVRGFPINTSEAIFVVALGYEENEILFTIPFDFNRGILNVIEPEAVGNQTLEERLAG